MDHSPLPPSKEERYIYADSRDELSIWQESQVQKCLEKILTLSPFYKEMYDGLPLHQWQDFPTVDRTLISDHADHLHQHQPGLPETSLEFIETHLIPLLHITEKDKRRVALFLPGYKEIQHLHNGSIISFYDLSENWNTQLEALQTLHPDTIIAPPKLLQDLVQAQKDGVVKLSPKKLFVNSKNLTPLLTRTVEECFSVQVQQIYQTDEGLYGIACSHGTLHLTEGHFVIQKEYLDPAQKRFVPIVTNFSQCKKPLIRFRTNEIMTEKSELCPCGSLYTAIEGIEDRHDHLFYLPSNHSKTLTIIFPAFISRSITRTSEEIEDCYIVQHSPQTLEIALAVPASQRRIIENQVSDTMIKLCNQVDCLVPRIIYTSHSKELNNKRLKKIKTT